MQKTDFHFRARRSIATFACVATLLGALPAHARGPSPYLPLNLSPEIERQIERVLILADVPAMRRPFAAATVLDALPKACARDRALCNRVRRYLAQYMESPSATHLSAELSYESDEVARVLPNRHGTTTGTTWHLSGTAVIQPTDRILLSIGGTIHRDEATPTGTLLSIGSDWAQLDIGWREHWFSPFTDSSALISTQSETMPSVTLSNYRPLTRFGFNYEVFLAQMAESDQILDGATFTEGNPSLAGLHVGIEPVPGWALSANRVMQFGGGSRGGSSLGDIFDAFFQPSEYDNVDDPINQESFGNQVASFTSRFIFPGRTPFAAYLEYAGEDTSLNADYRLGNVSLSAGIDFPRLGRRFDATYEVSEWQNAWYVNGIYRDGLANDGFVLGHWFGNERLLGDAVGGQSHMLRVGWRPAFGGQFDFRYRTIQNEDYGAIDYDRGHDFTVSYAIPWERLTVGAQLQGGTTVFGDDYTRLTAFVRFAEWIERGNVNAYATRDRDNPEGELFVDAGASATEVKIDLADLVTPITTTDMEVTPHIGIGARRAVGENHDLGVRMEIEEANDATLVAFRALDYRYRIGRHAAVTAFLGGARYDLATPAFGYYLGLGAQWRDILPNIDLSLDIKVAEKVARDKLVASDPNPAVGRPDVFYDIRSAGLYLSYKW